MRRSSFAFFAAILLTPLALHAQTTQTEAEARLLGKPLYLRTPVDGEKLKFSSDGTAQGSHNAVSFTEAGVDVTKVQMSGEHIKVEGIRVVTTFSASAVPSRQPMMVGKKDDRKPEKISIEIDNKGSKDFGPVLSKVFADGLPEMATSVPEYWSDFMRRFLHPDERPKLEPPNVFHVGGSVKKPKVLTSIDPEFSETARLQKFSGDVVVYLVIDENGDPSHVHIVRPAGMGLDEKAIEAVKQYKFRPAMLNDQPVPVDMNIAVNFQIF